MKNLGSFTKPKEEEQFTKVSRAINSKALEKYTWINSKKCMGFPNRINEDL